MREKVTFQDSEGNNLKGVFSLVNEDLSTPIMVLVHGFTIDKDFSPMPEFEKILNEKGVSTFRFDLFGHGESEGDFSKITITKGIDCVQKAINFLGMKGFRKIGLLGESFGGLCSTLTASDSDKLFVLCLKSPVSDYFEVENLRKSKERIKQWEEEGYFDFVNSFGKGRRINYSFYEDFKNHNFYGAAEKIIIPTFVVHGDADPVVPFEQSKRLVSKLSNGKLKIYSGVMHHFPDGKIFEDMLERVSNFAKENLN